MNTKIMQLEKRHRDIMKYTGGDMISFVLTCTELQKEMLAELKRIQERVDKVLANMKALRQEKELSK